MAKLTVHLANPTGIPYAWQTLVENVWDLLIPSFKSLNKIFSTLNVETSRTALDLPPSSVLVYMLQNSSASVVRRFAGISQSSGQDGLTYFDGTTSASEAYVVGRSPGYLANIIFHEILHNKLRMTDAQLHGHGGLAGSPVQPPATATDAKLMTRALRQNVSQWKGGFVVGIPGVTVY